MRWRGRAGGRTSDDRGIDDGPVPGRDYRAFEVDDIVDPEQRAWEEETIAQMVELAGMLPSNAKLVVPRTRVADFDLSVASLTALDAFLGRFPRLKDESAVTALLEQSAAYLFEVARRRFGGAYLQRDSEDPIVFVVSAEDMQVTLLGLSKVRERVSDPAHDIPFYFAGIGPRIRDGESALLM
jgi:hypothetical protein